MLFPYIFRPLKEKEKSNETFKPGFHHIGGQIGIFALGRPIFITLVDNLNSRVGLGFARLGRQSATLERGEN